MSKLLLLSLLANAPRQFVQDERLMGSMETIAYRGYPAEQHKVVTKDGYILTMHRIPHGRNGRRGGGPVLLQHGLLSSSYDFLSQDPSESLSYSLADAGYDVWLGNNRGNIYSTEHVKFGSRSRRFWNFSWHEMGEFDYPAMIDYVLHATRRRHLMIVGHSQGAQTFFTATTTTPSIQEKVKHFFAIAPSLSSGHLGSLAIRVGAKHPSIVNAALSVIPDRAYSLPVLMPFCGQDAFLEPCKWIFNEFSGPLDQVETERLPIVTSHIPAGTSGKNIKHWLQQIHNGSRHYDYGEEGNLAAYGTPHPREYDFSRYSVPTSVYYSPSDKLVSTEDMKLVLARIPSTAIVRARNITGFGHFEFIWGKRAKTEIYDEIIGIIKQISKINSTFT